jgi:antitoxin (DNA-binding transcriptional repressor) of toxin-antitoxin stability system
MKLSWLQGASLTLYFKGIVDMARFLAYIAAMKTANIGQLKDNLSKFISIVEKGETVAVCKRNIPVALMVPHGARKKANSTKLGCGRGTVQVLGDLTEPLIPEDAWDMHYT